MGTEIPFDWVLGSRHRMRFHSDGHYRDSGEVPELPAQDIRDDVVKLPENIRLGRF
jgi:hypothetical protein